MSANYLIYYYFFFSTHFLQLHNVKPLSLSEESYHCHVRKGSSMPLGVKIMNFANTLTLCVSLGN